MATRRLQFRRHLAACVLLLLLTEVDQRMRPPPPTTTTAPKRRPEEDQHQQHQLGPTRFHRIRLASAARLPAAGPHQRELDSAAAGGQQDHTTTTTSGSNSSLAPKWAHIYRPASEPAEFSLSRWAVRLGARLGRLLPVIDLNYSLAEPAGGRAARFPADQLDEEIDRYYNEQFAPNSTLDELVYTSVVAAKRMAPIPLHTSWGYTSDRLGALGSWPVGDERLCQLQLGHLAKRLARALELGPPPPPPVQRVDSSPAADSPVGSTSSSPVDNFESRLIYGTRDLQLMRLLDTYGRVPSDLLRGNTKWLGSYSSCLDSRLEPPDAPGTSRSSRLRHWDSQQWPAIRFRYCMGALRSAGWPQLHGNSSSNSNSLAQPPAGVAAGIGASHPSEAQTQTQTTADYFIRVGLCLPEACDSSALRANREAIERLAKLQLARPFNSDHYQLADLYCLPDDRSPLRAIPPAGRLLLLVCLAWLGLVGAATMVQLNVEKFYTRQVEAIRRGERRSQTPGSSNGSSQANLELAAAAGRPDGLAPASEGDQRAKLRESDILGLKWNWIKLNVAARDRARRLIVGVDLVECLSLYSNWLRYTRRVKLAIVELHRREQQLEAQLEAAAKSADAAAAHATEGPPDKATARTAGNRRVDTSSLNALKVIALVWIIAGHCIFYLGSVVTNGALLSNYLDRLVTFALSNGAIYITELFFIITGCLTSYLLFKHHTRVSSAQSGGGGDHDDHPPGQQGLQMQQLHHQLHHQLPQAGGPMRSVATDIGGSTRLRLDERLFRWPLWLVMVLHRYLRILPTYLLVYALVKLVSVYAGGEGPTWDYGVSPDSRRRACSEESWWPALTLTTNYLDIYEHCIVGGWYLSVDMQFMLMAVPLLAYLARCQRAAFRCAQPTDHAPQQQAAARKKKKRSAGPRLGKLGAGSPSGNGTGNSHQREVGVEGQITQQTARPRPASGWPPPPPPPLAAAKLAPAYALVGCLAAASALLSIYFGMVGGRADISYLVKFSPHSMAMMAQNISLYTNSIFRFRAYLVGLLVGHCLYLYEFGQLALPAPIQRHGTKLTSLLFLAGFCLMFAPVLYPRGKIVLSHDTTVLLMVLCALGVDLFLAALIFMLAIGKAPKLALFLVESPFWSLFSSLSLSAFLCHTELIIVLVSQLDPPPSVSYSLLLFVFSATLLLTYSLALGLYLTFELPISRLIESIMRKCLARRDDDGPKGGAAS